MKDTTSRGQPATYSLNNASDKANKKWRMIMQLFCLTSGIMGKWFIKLTKRVRYLWTKNNF